MKPMKLTADDIKKELNIDSSFDAETWINEALFGFSQIAPYCQKLARGSTVLEIGSGSGILLYLLTTRFPHLEISGLEPFGLGFDALRNLNTKIKSRKVNIHECEYSNYKPSKKIDLIFSVNVFEHLPDFKNHLDWSLRQISKHGQQVILCPNYSFPYESHFKIPIIVNKEITSALFRKKIRKHEALNNCSGLWLSLNFIKKRQIFYFLSREPRIIVNDDLSIITELFERFDTDTTFRNRQYFISKFSRLLKTLSFAFRFFPNYAPYMKLVISSKDSTH